MGEFLEVPFTWNDADDNGQFSSGDTFSETFSGCVFSGITFSGSVTLSNFSLTGDPSMLGSPWSMSASFSYNSLVVSDATGSEAVSGSFAFTLSSDGTTETGTIVVASLSVTESGSTTSLGSVTVSYSEDPLTGQYSYSINGTITDGTFGTVSVTTTVPFSGTDIDTNWPESGSMTITGGNGSRLIVTAMGGGNVQLEVYTDAADTVADVINRTWAQLELL